MNAPFCPAGAYCGAERGSCCPESCPVLLGHAEERQAIAELRTALSDLLALARAQVLPTLPGRAEVLDAAERALATSARYTPHR